MNYISVAEAAEELEVSETQVRSLVKHNLLKVDRYGKDDYFYEVDVKSLERYKVARRLPLKQRQIEYAKFREENK